MAGGSPEEKHISSTTYQYISPSSSSFLHNAIPSFSTSQRENAYLSSSSSSDSTSTKQSRSNQMKRRDEEEEEGDEDAKASRNLFPLHHQGYQEEGGNIEETLQDFTNVWRNSGGLLGYLASSSSSIPRAGREFDENLAQGRKDRGEIVGMESEEKNKSRDEREDREKHVAEDSEDEEGEFLRYCRIFFREQEKQELELLQQPLEE